MVAADAEATKPSVGRRILDVLSLLGGLIALFQFLISDNVSSQWFKPARDWIAKTLDLTEELAGFSNWWNNLVSLPNVKPLSEAPTIDVIVVVGVALFYGFLFTFFVPFALQDWRDEWRNGPVSLLFAATGSLVFFVAIPVYAFLATAAPPAAWVALGIAAALGLAAGISVVR